MVIEKETQEVILDVFKSRITTLNIKYASKRFYEEQASFVAGVALALSFQELEVPPIWLLYIMSGREIYERDKKEF